MRVRRNDETLTLERLMSAYEEKGAVIRERLREFEEVSRTGDDRRYLEELAFCIFAAGTSARHGIQCVEKVRPLLLGGDREELREAIRGQRFYNVRSGFLHAAREYLREHCGLCLKETLSGFTDFQARRNWLALNRDIPGIGMKEASHYLRNVGFKGYAILDKHILRGLHELGVLDAPGPPGRPDRYREIEAKLHAFSREVGIDPDEMDLLLWSERTGEILK
jgi:N-glycosylase/DNA lyase